ncbi:MAG TPA: hydantoinase/oxoprolinase family protein, partial [Dehalococcoidia bacterium]|nr:hydantoinase/oxoprolinase family protein [Dehalococcoidia bacterium]
EPGPACYGRGGVEPTVADANLLLGRLPASLLGGELALDVDAARRAIEEVIARPLGLSAVEAAEGIVALADNAMIGAIRTISIARGLDPRGYALVAFGGAGPLHAPALASALGIETVVVPPRPGVLSTEGLLRTDLRNDYVRTCTQAGPHYDVTQLAVVLAELTAQAHADLDREGVPRERRLLRSAADLRYRHQNAELTVELRDDPFTPALLAEIEEAFHREHERLYSYALRGQTVELVNLRVAATGLLPHVEPAAITASESAAPPPEPPSTRRIYFGAAHGWLETPCMQREALRPGDELHGPLAIDQLDSTTVLRPGNSARVDGYGNLILHVGG